MSFPNILFMPDGEQYNTYTQQNPVPSFGRGFRYPMGTQLVLQDGRKFRFAENGGTLLVVGNVITSAAILATDINMTPAAGAIGDQLITFTHGAATTVANFFAEGFAVVSVTPGGGDTYKIRSHKALRNATAGDIVNLDVGMALRRALTTTSRVDLMAHPYSGVIQSAATTLTGAPMGVAVSAIPATANAGWLQTRGTVGVLTSGTLVVGNRAVVPLGTAGACGPETAVAGTSATQVTIGTVQSLAASTAWSSIFLTIDG